jgi:hypothetical protein
VASLLAAVTLALHLGREIAWLCAGVMGLGLFHRRLKSSPTVKALYVTLAWVGATVGLPALQGTKLKLAIQPELIVWVAAIYTGAIGANLLASSLGGRASAGLPQRSRSARKSTPGWRMLDWARASALGASLLALGAPPELRGLAWIPLAELVALVGFRNKERYALACLDGALLLGSLLALATRWLADG